MNKRSQKDIVLNFLRNGNTLSSAQAANSFRIGNVREVVRRLRAEGNPIYTNRANGKTVYRLGSVRKSVVANAYRRNGANAFE